jgi:3-hydroxyisobutyrate dehydrogenase-like beta-hydroxyacid dehydrogenase
VVVVSRDVVVVTGLGEMGQAIARHVGHGVDLLLADYNPETLDAATDKLRGEGYASPRS